MYYSPITGGFYHEPYVKDPYERDTQHGRNLSRSISSGSRPEGAPLGHLHRTAFEENIMLDHIEGGCFNGGICEDLYRRIVERTCEQLGYNNSDFTCLREAVRVAAGLPAVPPDADAPTQSNREQGVLDRQLPGSASTGRDHHGAQEGPSRRAGEPQTVEEENRRKRQCFDHGCNGRRFSTFSNLLRHQREKSRIASKSVMPAGGPDTDAPPQSDREQGDHGGPLPGSASTGREHRGTPEAQGRNPREPEELRERPGSSMGRRRDVDVHDLSPMLSPTLPACVEERLARLREDTAQTNGVEGSVGFSHDSETDYDNPDSDNPDSDMLKHEADKTSLDGGGSSSSDPPNEIPGDTTDEEDWASIGAAALRQSSFPLTGGSRIFRGLG
ncbi:MAG: hypothetical protein Q9226_003125 [Calogaya cf. arnoldii]